MSCPFMAFILIEFCLMLGPGAAEDRILGEENSAQQNRQPLPAGPNVSKVRYRARQAYLDGSAP